MLRRLVLMRHARAAGLLAPDGSGLAKGGDHARPLTPDGREDAVDMGVALAVRGWGPDLVLSSDSARTKQTWACLSVGLGEDLPVRVERALYNADAETLLDELGVVEDEVRTVLVLAHNPGLQELAYGLTGEEFVIATANVLLLCAEGATWREALRRRWRLEAGIQPKAR